LQTNLKDVHEKQKEKSLGSSTGGERAGLGRRGTLHFDRESMMEVDELDPRGKGRKFMYVLSIHFDITLLNCLVLQDPGAETSYSKKEQILNSPFDTCLPSFSDQKAVYYFSNCTSKLLLEEGTRVS
jgi:hypothetical protein